MDAEVEGRETREAPGRPIAGRRVPDQPRPAEADPVPVPGAAPPVEAAPLAGRVPAVEERSDDDVDSDAPARVQDGLTDRQRQMLAFEKQWWKHAGSKEQAIRDLFGLSPTRYYQVLNQLLDDPAALAYDPVLVKRLRRLRATRTRSRTR